MDEIFTVLTSVVISLQWSKKNFEFDIEVPNDAMTNEGYTKFTGRSLMDAVYSLTKVPVDRQKLVVSKPKMSKSTAKRIVWWKGVLKEDFDFASALKGQDDTNDVATGTNAGPIKLSVTLMGTAEVLEPSQNKTIFLEDMTPAEKKEAEKSELMNSLANVAAMIPALQIPPTYRQPPITGSNVGDGSYEEVRSYDNLVHGFSQLRIDALLRHQQNPQNQSLRENAFPSPPRLLGRVVLTLGLEIQRAYVNDLAVLSEDGTLVSGLDDGHIHMWKHCQKVKDFVHESAGGIGIFDAFSGVDSVVALDNGQGYSTAAFATAGRGCVRVWDSEGDPLLGRSSPLPFASPTGLIRIPISSPKRKANDDNNVLCIAARFRVAPPPSRRPRLVPQDNAGRRRINEIENSESMVVEDLTKLSKSVQILYVETASHNDGATSSSGTQNETFGTNAGKPKPTLRSAFLNTLNPVTAMESWKDGKSTIFVVGDSLGGIMFWKVALAASSSPHGLASARGSQSTSVLHGSRSTASYGNQNSDNNALKLTCTKLRYLKIASIEDPTESRSAIACLKYLSATKQLFVSTKEIPPTPIASLSMDDSSGGDVVTTCFPLKPPQAVHCLNTDAILNKSHHDPLDFTLDGHKDVVQSILPLPNGDLVTAGGRMDATTKVWTRLQLWGAMPRSTEQNNETMSISSMLDSSPPPVLTKAATANLTGYVFETALLEDFKSRDSSKGDARNPFAIAVAQYNVVRIVI